MVDDDMAGKRPSMLLLALLVFAASASLYEIWQAPVRADVPHPSIAHPGSMVVFVHYMPPYEGDQRAAMILEHPRACPPDTPNGMTDCANLRFWTVKPSETENPTNVLDGEGLPTGEHTNNGDDWRCCVPHDPTGKFPRSWHLWGEAPGEEDQ